uniref:uncharacterized protein LOC122597000 n=1 Tax=Erigeron canadensis TaxID=72917 RepID=UPI001CB92EF5|nr:uncharacterized protein LOC122597000 [Erigeron canadensis]
MQLIGPEIIVETTEWIAQMKENLMKARDRQKKYADNRRKPLEFRELSNVHNVFHVPNLKKCLADETTYVPLNEIRVDDNLSFKEEPVEIMDREVNKLKRHKYTIVKVCWNSRRGQEFTWE